MNYTTDYTLILTALYILIIAIAFSPKCPHVSPDSPVPEVIDKSIEKTQLVNLPDTTASPIPQAIAVGNWELRRL